MLILFYYNFSIFSLCNLWPFQYMVVNAVNSAGDELAKQGEIALVSCIFNIESHKTRKKIFVVT